MSKTIKCVQIRPPRKYTLTDFARIGAIMHHKYHYPVHEMREALYLKNVPICEPTLIEKLTEYLLQITGATKKAMEYIRDNQRKIDKILKKIPKKKIRITLRLIVRGISRWTQKKLPKP